MKSGSHIIADISYSKDWLLCTCGWEGKAYDHKGYYTHRKESPLLENAVDYIQPYPSVFMRRKVVEESY